MRPFACVLGYIKWDNIDVLHLRHDNSACRHLEVSDSPLQLLHHCGEGKTKYQALFLPLEGPSSSDYRAAFFHATDDERGKTNIVDALHNFAQNRTLSDANRNLVENGRDILETWFALQLATPSKPSTCTDELAWDTLRTVFTDPGYWFSHEELRCLAYISSCDLHIHISQDLGRSATTESCMHCVQLPRQAPTAHVMLRMGGLSSRRGHFVRLVDETEWQSLHSRV